MTGNNPTDRSKLGTKRHILTDKDGIPLSTVITSANTHDVTVAIDTVDSIVIKRPLSTSSITKYRNNNNNNDKNKNKKKNQNLCLDKAYNSQEIEQEITKRGYIPHIRHRREEEEKKHNNRRHAARRWVVERTNSWHNRFRKLFTRYEKKDEDFLGLVQLANSLIVYRRLILGYLCELFHNFYFISYFFIISPFYVYFGQTDIYPFEAFPHYRLYPLVKKVPQLGSRGYYPQSQKRG
jgi:transposase